MENVKERKRRYLLKNGYSQEIIDFACSNELHYDTKFKALVWVAKERKRQEFTIEETNRVLDWYNYMRSIDLYRMNFQQAIETANGRNERKIRRYEGLKKLPLSDETIVFSDGDYHIVLLDTDNKFDLEGCLMNNCINSDFKFEEDANGIPGMLYSIRDNKNNPHVTFTIHDDGLYFELSEIKGKCNSFPKLKYFTIFINWIKEKGIKNLKMSLDLSNNPSKLIRLVLKKMSFLSSIKLCTKKISSIPFKDIRQLKNLTSLDISHSDLSELPEWIGKLKYLEYLYLNNNKLIHLPEWIGRLKNLNFLDVQNNQLVEIPASIGKLTKLFGFLVYNNKLSCLPEEIGKLKHLMILDISNNQLTELPDCVGNLTNLSGLIMSNNKIAELPDSITQCIHLILFDLSNNRIKKLPEDIGKISQLLFFYCNNNYLSKIPESIEDLTLLSRYNFNNNFLPNFPACIEKFLHKNTR